MAVLSFNKQKGSAKKEVYEMKPDLNSVRLVGGILPRYVYWLSVDGKAIPMECLEFNRDTEIFDKAEKDYVREFFPDVRNASWGYIATVIDLSDGKIKPFFLKKKLWDQICAAAADGLGDPTDPETGWDVIFTRVKTGSSRMNVEYRLNVLKCKARPLTEEERETLKELPDLEKLYPRPTPEEQKKSLEELRDGEKSETADEGIDSEFNDLA